MKASYTIRESASDYALTKVEPGGYNIYAGSFATIEKAAAQVLDGCKVWTRLAKDDFWMKGLS